MGSVYLARHPRLPRLTALKLLNRELYTDAEIRARFEREADLCAQLDHPGIVAVYDRGVEDDQLWICMQYVDGVDAADRKSTRLNSSHPSISYAVFCLKKKKSGRVTYRWTRRPVDQTRR